MRHEIQGLAVKLLGDGKGFTQDARLALMKAYLAAGCDEESFEAASKGLIELATAWRKSGRDDAACTLAVLVMSTAPMIASIAARRSTERTQRAERSAKKLFGTTSVVPSAPGSGASGSVGVKATFARFSAAAGRTTREG